MAKVILNALDCPEGELSIVIVDDSQITELNQNYFNRQGPTNVIAFPMREGPFSEITPELLGDVVISAETARRESQSADMAFSTRYKQLLVHGILHLFGYNHENDYQEAEVMEAKSRELMHLIEAEDWHA